MSFPYLLGDNTGAFTSIESQQLPSLLYKREGRGKVGTEGLVNARTTAQRLHTGALNHGSPAEGHLS